ncbi:hypothetical protein B7C51_18295 [Paenibacillus larvae subsp. pulvifaciens]|uniref:Sensor histidine kinase NatK-like C-terminal domain-containing protein n=1 Tax=Paenibacillus larvae subsp. pulvifaciens TaxID=1477 RepID=A0A1V0UVS0_9BACL|nr:ATP-binding protein [Paenibacillus larvae]ARF69343.1 hypothetical protein B7C51_18295 [Paenibacillus larvae subsp. pulvifaciens]
MHDGLFIGTTLLELVLLHCYFAVLFYAPDKSKRVIGINYAAAGSMLFFSSVSFFPPLVTGLLSIGSAFLVSLLYPARMKTRLVFSVLYLLLGFIAELLSFYFISLFQNLKGEMNLTTLETRLLLLLVSSCLMLLFILILRFIKWKKYDYKLRLVYYFIITLMLLFSLLILNTLFFYAQRNWFNLLSIVGVLCINMLTFFLFDRMTEKYRLADENYQLQKQMDYQDNSYEKTAHSFKSIKRIIHDTKKQLVFIRACIQEQRLQEAIVHINQTLEHMNAAYLRITTGNLVIDALVSHALNIANDNGIALKHDIRITASDIRLDRYDLCMVIGNVLDNAIEAVRLVPNKEDKFIHLRMSSNSHSLFIHVVNSRLEQNQPNQRTLKDNPDFHGFGLTNIQRVAEKYGGYLQTKARNRQFETSIMLPLSDEISPTI